MAYDAAKEPTTNETVQVVFASLAILLGFLGVLAGAVMLPILSGFLVAKVIADFWLWFIVPPSGWPALSLVTVWAVLIIRNILGFRKHRTEDRFWYRLSMNFTALMLVWGVGALVHAYGAPWPFNHG